MTTTIRAAAALAVGLAVALGATGCASDAPAPTSSSGPGSTAPSTTTGAGSTSSGATGTEKVPTPAAILDRAKANALSATSGAFSGNIQNNGSTMRIAFKGTTDGKTSDVEIEQKGLGTVRLISVDDAVYIKADEAFWKEQGAPEEVQQAGDKFVKAPPSAASLTDDLNLKTFLSKAFSSLDTSEIDGQVGSETVDGVDCWVLTDKSGKANGAFYVAKGTYQLVRFTGTQESPGQLDFSQWNEDLGIAAPSPDDVLDLG
jgi:hypothetical protein